MAALNENGTLSHVASPFLRHPEQPPSSSAASSSREFRQSLERLERINMNDLEPIRTASENKRQNRLSREILGVDDPILSAPDNARAAGNEEPGKIQEEDAGSVIGAASIASTVPDRYGFIGGSQYTQDHK